MNSEKTDGALEHIEANARSNSLVALSRPKQPSSWVKSRRFSIGVSGAIVLALAAAWWGLNPSGGAPRVAVETLAAGPLKRVLAMSGRTETDIHADVRSLIAARVSKVMAKEGDSIADGDVLVILDDSRQASRVKQAREVLDAAILREQSMQADRDRAEKLGGTVSAVALANAERDLALAKAEVDRQRAALDQERLALADYRIHAPISGLVLERSIDPGDLVNPSDILMRLANTDTLHVEVQVDEIYADKIRIGQRAFLQLAGRRETLSGAVSFVAAEVDELTGSLLVKLAFDTPPDARIGLTTVANILIDTVDKAVTVPRSALVSRGDDAAVFVLRDGKARLTPISYVDWPADRVEVTSGLTESDRIVLSPEGIQDGQALAAQDSAAASD